MWEVGDIKYGSQVMTGISMGRRKADLGDLGVGRTEPEKQDFL